MVYADKGSNSQCHQPKILTRPNYARPHPFHRIGTLDTGEGVPFFLKATMGKDPAFLFYSADFLIGTSFMTSEEVGDYIRILCHMHQLGGHMEHPDIVSIAPKVTQRVLKKFSKSENGLYFHNRLLAEINKRKAFTESRMKNLSKRHMATHMRPHMENENENRNENININIKNNRRPENLAECAGYFIELGMAEEASAFFDHFTSNGWKVGGKAPMKDWHAAARTWVRRSKPKHEVETERRKKIERSKEWRPPKKEDCSPPPKEFLALKSRT